MKEFFPWCLFKQAVAELFVLTGFLLIFSIIFIRARLRCFIPLPEATLSFQNFFTFQSFGVSEESCIAFAFLIIQGELF